MVASQLLRHAVEEDFGSVPPCPPRFPLVWTLRGGSSPMAVDGDLHGAAPRLTTWPCELWPGASVVLVVSQLRVLRDE